MRTQLKNLAFPVLMVLAVVLVNFFVYYTSVCGIAIVTESPVRCDTPHRQACGTEILQHIRCAEN